VTGSKLNVVAVAAVFLGAAVCLAVITAGVFEYAYYRSILRQAEAD
jgi:hypothetical protein